MRATAYLAHRYIGAPFWSNGEIQFLMKTQGLAHYMVLFSFFFNTRQCPGRNSENNPLFQNYFHSTMKRDEDVQTHQLSCELVLHFPRSTTGMQSVRSSRCPFFRLSVYRSGIRRSWKTSGRILLGTGVLKVIAPYPRNHVVGVPFALFFTTPHLCHLRTGELERPHGAHGDCLQHPKSSSHSQNSVSRQVLQSKKRLLDYSYSSNTHLEIASDMRASPGMYESARQFLLELLPLEASSRAGLKWMLSSLSL